MTDIERKARKFVKQLYFDYKAVRTYETFNSYYAAMVMLKHLFPESTDVETLERTWTVQWRKENKND